MKGIVLDNSYKSSSGEKWKTARRCLRHRQAGRPQEWEIAICAGALLTQNVSRAEFRHEICHAKKLISPPDISPCAGRIARYNLDRLYGLDLYTFHPLSGACTSIIAIKRKPTR